MCVDDAKICVIRSEFIRMKNQSDRNWLLEEGNFLFLRDLAICKFVG